MRLSKNCPEISGQFLFGGLNLHLNKANKALTPLLPATSMAYMLQPPSLLKDIHMTVNEVKPHDTSSAVTPHQHHTQAAEHLELAAKSHKAADEHVKTAHAHVAKAQEHVVAAAAKTPSLTK